MYDAYVSGTVIPLVEANVRSDNGEMGGSEPRLAVLSEVAGSPAPDTDQGKRCWIMHKFTEGLHTLLQNFPEAAETINRHRGGLHAPPHARRARDTAQLDASYPQPARAARSAARVAGGAHRARRRLG